jgi:hypothetical protein
MLRTKIKGALFQIGSIARVTLSLLCYQEKIAIIGLINIDTSISEEELALRLQAYKYVLFYHTFHILKFIKLSSTRHFTSATS